MKTKKDIFGFFLRFSLKTVFFMSIIKISSLCKLSFIWGSTCANFSGSCATIPLAGVYAGGFVSVVLFVFSFLIRYLIFGVYSLHILAFYLPGLCAALSISSHVLCKTCMKLLVPLLCIILFICHPVGIQAFGYSLFWAIPIVLYFVKQKSIFLDALSATFVAHAVGSVIFLYTVQLHPAAWNALIPIVMLERLAIASLIYVLYKLFGFVKTFDKVLNFCPDCGKLFGAKFVK